MLWALFCVFAPAAILWGIGQWLGDVNHRAWQRKMDRQFDEACARADADTAPTDWEHILAGFPQKGQRRHP